MRQMPIFFELAIAVEIETAGAIGRVRIADSDHVSPVNFETMRKGAS